MKDNLRTTIGLEVHIQLDTERKMFCFCSNRGENESPNKFVCPICLGMPGTLPVPNKKAIEFVVKIGLALGCEIAEKSKFDRKHYFYPDLPKGYQISQYDMPFVKSGGLEVESDGKVETIRINRVHLEEDAGKLVHQDDGFTAVDLNRAGTPLAELVTEPDIHSPEQAKVFAQQLQKIVRAIGVSSANMEKGHMRCDANISVTDGSKRSPIIEIKNLNSFKFIEKALLFEERRLREEFDKYTGSEGKITRGFDSKSGETYALRYKEEAKDYRYFPEPDIPPFDLTDKNFINIDKLRGDLPKLPSEVISELVGNGVSSDDARTIVSNADTKKLLLDAIGRSVSPELIGRIAKLLINENGARNLNIDQLLLLAKEIEEKKLPSNVVRRVIKGEITLDEIGTDSSHGVEELEEIVDSVLSKNQDAVLKYKSGKKEVMGFLIGCVMREARGSNPGDVSKILQEKIV